MNKKPIKLEITYDDGSRDLAENETADEVLRWWVSGEYMNDVHGIHYSGGKLILIPAPAPEVKVKKKRK